MGDNMKTKIIFVRHAEAEGNFTRTFQGFTDGLLTEKGHMQASLAAKKLKDIEIDVLYSSSLKRTLQTAQYISDIKNLPIIRTDKLKEINGGEWEGQRWDQLASKWPKELFTWDNKPHLHQMPNGESMIEFQKRLIEEVLYIEGNNKGRNICVVTHGTAIRSLMAIFRHKELDEMLEYAVLHHKGPIAIRYPRGKGQDKLIDSEPIKYGRGVKIREGNDLTILTVGDMVETSMKTAFMLQKMGISSDVINVRFIKPLDMKLIINSVTKTKRVVIIENNTVVGGMGSYILEMMNQLGVNVKTKIFGFPDQPIVHGSKNELYIKYKMDPESLNNEILKIWGNHIFD